MLKKKKKPCGYVVFSQHFSFLIHSLELNCVCFVKHPSSVAPVFWHNLFDSQWLDSSCPVLIQSIDLFCQQVQEISSSCHLSSPASCRGIFVSESRHFPEPQPTAAERPSKLCVKSDCMVQHRTAEQSTTLLMAPEARALGKSKNFKPSNSFQAFFKRNSYDNCDFQKKKKIFFMWGIGSLSFQKSQWWKRRGGATQGHEETDWKIS